MSASGNNNKSVLLEVSYRVEKDEWEVLPSQVVMESTLSEGAFGEVHQGFIRGPLNNPNLTSQIRKSVTVPVAIKMIKGIACCEY